MKPVIGITCNFDWERGLLTLAEGYYQAVSHGGGIPLLLSFGEMEDWEAVLSRVDGLLLSGGPDIDPYLFGEEPHIRLGRMNPVRDRLEMALTRKAMDMGIPLLGICRGIQVMNAAMGGTLYQDLESQWRGGELIHHTPDAPRWYPTHEIIIEHPSILSRIMEAQRIRVNSFHHQAVKEPAPGFEVVARSRDGVIEAIASPNHPFALGVQWHPETMWEKDGRMLALFQALVEAAREYAGS